MSVDLNTATLDELQAEFVRLAGVVVTASNERVAIAKTIEARKADAQVHSNVDVAKLTRIERGALMVALQEADAAEIKSGVMQ